jgi:glutamate-1-semialdehyde 2,1-aminomutase/spore coat polysaccharide biosynthesis protein SpsF
MGSTRFPGKVLADLDGQPMLLRIVHRVERSAKIQQTIVVTSDQKSDDRVAELCSARGITVFRGSEKDVLDRFYQAAKTFHGDIVVRITGDCPFIDPEVIDRVVSGYLSVPCDYASNTVICTYPDGLDTEVFSFAALENAWRNGRRAADREHVTPYLRTSQRFRLRNVESGLGRSLRHLRWTVDEPCDLEFARAVYSRFGGQDTFGWQEVLRLIDKEPALTRLNAGRVRNEGYYHSIAEEPALPAVKVELTRSKDLAKEAANLIPGASQTLSKGPTQYVQGVAPTFLTKGEGCRVWDPDGNRYIDYSMGLGPMILGYGYPAVDEAVRKQLADGVTFSLPHPLEITVAERLVEMIPCAEMVRFGKNGSDATAGAVRLARAFTGRDRIVCCGYHGWQDWFIGTTSFNAGVPESVRRLTSTFEYNNIESLKRLLAEHPRETAAVILEPVGIIEPAPGFLQEIRELCNADGCVLIFDEVITGFRLAQGGAQEYFGVLPDLACFGKAMANGYPLSAVVGSRRIMKCFESTFFSFTFGGEALSLAAADATMREIRAKNVIARLWEHGSNLMDGTNALAREFGLEKVVRCIGLPPRTVVTFTDESNRESSLIKSLFQQECLRRGVFFSGAHNLSFSHTSEDIEYTLRVYRSVMEILGKAVRQRKISESLEGTPLQPVFRRP